jgi:hypothetical protein
MVFTVWRDSSDVCWWGQWSLNTILFQHKGVVYSFRDGDALTTWHAEKFTVMRLSNKLQRVSCTRIKNRRPLEKQEIHTSQQLEDTPLRHQSLPVSRRTWYFSKVKFQLRPCHWNTQVDFKQVFILCVLFTHRCTRNQSTHNHQPIVIN